MKKGVWQSKESKAQQTKDQQVIEVAMGPAMNNNTTRKSNNL